LVDGANTAKINAQNQVTNAKETLRLSDLTVKSATATHKQLKADEKKLED